MHDANALHEVVDAIDRLDAAVRALPWGEVATMAQRSVDALAGLRLVCRTLAAQDGGESVLPDIAETTKLGESNA